MQLSSKFMSVPISNYICIYDIRSEHYITKHEQISEVYKSPKNLVYFVNWKFSIKMIGSRYALVCIGWKGPPTKWLPHPNLI